MAIAKSGRALGKSEKILLGTVGVLAVAFIYWTLLIEPALVKLKPLEEQVKELKLQVKDTNTIESDIVRKEKELEELKVRYEEATKVLSKTDRYPDIIRDIRNVATSNSLKIVSEELNMPKVDQEGVVPLEDGTVPSNPTDGLQTMNVNLTVEGEFNNALEFINKLEEDQRILEITGIVAKDKSIGISITYYIAGGEEVEEYDFNNGTYGKDNIFN